MQFWVPDAIAEIPESAWRPLDDYPENGEAQIAETRAGGRRLIVRRTRLIGAQAELWPDWRYFPFITNRTEPLEIVEAEHRQHAVVELAIRDLKDQALAHFPSGVFCANSAWTVIGALAHNLMRWTTLIGPAGRDRSHRAHPAPSPARAPRPTDPQRPPLDSSPAGPLALAGGLRGGSDTDPGAASRSLNSSSPACLTCRIARRHGLLVPGCRPATNGHARSSLARSAHVIQRSSPLTRSRTAIPLSLMVNRWIEA